MLNNGWRWRSQAPNLHFWNSLCKSHSRTLDQSQSTLTLVTSVTSSFFGVHLSQPGYERIMYLMRSPNASWYGQMSPGWESPDLGVGHCMRQGNQLVGIMGTRGKTKSVGAMVGNWLSNTHLDWTNTNVPHYAVALVNHLVNTTTNLKLKGS